jgi:hypothetical protein
VRSSRECPRSVTASVSPRSVASPPPETDRARSLPQSPFAPRARSLPQSSSRPPPPPLTWPPISGTSPPTAPRTPPSPTALRPRERGGLGEPHRRGRGSPRVVAQGRQPRPLGDPQRRRQQAWGGGGEGQDLLQQARCRSKERGRSTTPSLPPWLPQEIFHEVRAHVLVPTEWSHRIGFLRNTSFVLQGAKGQERKISYQIPILQNPFGHPVNQRGP